MGEVVRWLRAVLAMLAPQPTMLSGRERLRVSVGALVGIFATGVLTALSVSAGNVLPVLVAPMAASAVLVFVLPASPLAQPWAVIGGNMVSAAIGVACAKWISPALIASAVAVAAAIVAMLLLRCLHPPGGAMALTAVLGGPTLTAAGFDLVWMPVVANSVALVLAATVFHRLTRHRYPHHPMLAAAQPAPPQVHARPFTDADLASALRDGDEIIDIDVEDLMLLVQRAEQHAARRMAEVKASGTVPFRRSA